MKRKMTALLTLALLTTLLLGGCGGTESKSDTMTVSEMLETVLKDNGGEVYIYKADTKYHQNVALGKDMPVGVYVYDGEGINWCQEEGRTESGRDSYKLGDIANNKVNFEKGGEKDLVLGLDLETDDTGNDVYIEAIQTENDEVYLLGGFSRIEVYDTTYMCFATRVTHLNTYDNWKTEIYYLIEDTESTKDKTIVWDKIGTDNILIDEVNVRKAVYSPIIPQPAD